MATINKDLMSSTQRVSKQEKAPIGEINSQRKFIPWGTMDIKGKLHTISKVEAYKPDDLNQTSESLNKDSLMMESSVPFMMEEPSTNRDYKGSTFMKGV